MKPPPFLLAAALLFWGWQTDFLMAGLLMALVLESARLIKARWEFSDDDFARLWTFCALLFLGTAVYAFTANEGPSRIASLFENFSVSTTNAAGNANAEAAAAFFRWLPMTFFLFVAAQTFSTREAIPLNTISLIMRMRWKRAAKLGHPLPPARGVNVAFPYFAICLFSAGIHDPGANLQYFWGLWVLLVWALWTQRSSRFGVFIWAGTLMLAVLLGFGGQYGIMHLAGYFGRMNPEWLTQFMHKNKDASQSRTAIGRIGELKLSGKIVIRLQPKTGPVPEYLREVCYRTYQKRVWFAGKSKDDFESVSSETNSTTWQLLPGKTNAYAVQIGCYLEGGKDLLSLPEDCGRLENLPAFTMTKNSAGTVQVEGPGVVVFDALYGPGPMIDSEPDDLQDRNMPESETNALDQVIAQLPVTGTNLEARLRAVNAFFQERFTYSTWQDRPQFADTNLSDLGRFLLKTHSGHCEYFATATALLLRQMGIPTRYATGFAVHEKSGTGYVVRLRDAHAWCLIWNQEKKTWQDFDTTPAVWVETEAGHRSLFEWLSDAWSWSWFQFNKFRLGQTHLREYILILLVPVLLLLLARIFFRQKRRRKKPGRNEMPTVWPGLDSEFYLIEKHLAGRGVPRHVNEPLTGWLERITQEPALIAQRKPLRHLLRLHYRCRFDPPGLEAADREALRCGVREVLEALGKS